MHRPVLIYVDQGEAEPRLVLQQGATITGVDPGSCRIQRRSFAGLLEVLRVSCGATTIIVREVAIGRLFLAAYDPTYDALDEMVDFFGWLEELLTNPTRQRCVLEKWVNGHGEVANGEC
jgi:hypothetical protein